MLQKIILAFIYPAVITFVAALVVGGLLTYVVPQVVQVFAHTRQELPLLTRALIGLSDFVRSFGWIVAVLGAVAAYVVHRMLKVEAVRLRWHACSARPSRPRASNPASWKNWNSWAGRSSTPPWICLPCRIF